MLRYVSILFIGLLMVWISTTNAQPLLGKENAPLEIVGGTTNGMEPHLLIEQHGNDWNIEIDYEAQTNFAKYTWLKPSQRVGSKLQLWLTSDIELMSTNSGVLTAMRLPSQTTVLDVMKDIHPSSRRGILWLQIEPGKLFAATGFNLKSYYDISFTNDVALQITPLLYKIETNQVTAHLIEFPPIKMKLLSNGEVEKIKGK